MVHPNNLKLSRIHVFSKLVPGRLYVMRKSDLSLEYVRFCFSKRGKSKTVFCFTLGPGPPFWKDYPYVIGSKDTFEIYNIETNFNDYDTLYDWSKDMKILGFKYSTSKHGSEAVTLYCSVPSNNDSVVGETVTQVYCTTDKINCAIKVGTVITVAYGQAFMYQGKLVQPILSIDSITN